MEARKALAQQQKELFKAQARMTELDVVLRHGGVVKVHTRTPVTDTGVELGGVIVSVTMHFYKIIEKHFYVFHNIRTVTFSGCKDFLIWC